jgi:mRNA-degrading endonuclease RelE of RelBE toxin-antitoxin system
MYKLIFAPEIADHLAAIDKKRHSTILDKIDEQLLHEPNIQTRNRKPLNQPSIFGDAWELRFGQNNRFRVFYKVYSDQSMVEIIAIGMKENNRLMIGGEEVTL